MAVAEVFTAALKLSMVMCRPSSPATGRGRVLFWHGNLVEKVLTLLVGKAVSTGRGETSDPEALDR